MRSISQIFINILALFFLVFCGEREYGSLYVESTPSGAVLFVNGINSGKYTPATLMNLDRGNIRLEVRHDDYLFERSIIQIIADSIIKRSFTLLSLSDSAVVIGELELGILKLPSLPIKTPFLIDGKQSYSTTVTLSTGLHKIVWEGGNRYTSLDTTVEIFAGRLSTFRFNPQRLMGTICISAYPKDANLFIGQRYLGTGFICETINTGNYTITVQRGGYYQQSKSVSLFPESTDTLLLYLDKIPDYDKDGFLDSCDACPKTYGIYDGCPKFKPSIVILRYKDAFHKNFMNQPFSISMPLINLQKRNPHNSKFAELTSYFNDGTNVFNNVNGISLLNAISITYKGLYLSCELGQWSSPLLFKKHYFSPLIIESDSTSYYCLYDTIAKIETQISIPSTSINFGINFKMGRIALRYGIGYQWEDIIINNLVNVDEYDLYTEKLSEFKKEINSSTDFSSYPKYTGIIKNIQFNNDFWFQVLHAEINLLPLNRSQPVLYFETMLSIGKIHHTGWHSFKTGILVHIIPSEKKRRIFTEKLNDRSKD